MLYYKGNQNGGNMKKIIIKQQYKPNKKFGRERGISRLIPLENLGPEPLIPRQWAKSQIGSRAHLEWVDPPRLNPPDSIRTEVIYKSGRREEIVISSKKIGKKINK
tara:strand:- start:352 stop:669 length:318 start_codon:yes stop_codon:yes gene_type:complete